MLSDMPADLKAAIRAAFLDAPTKAKGAFDRLSDGKDREMISVEHKDYVPTIEMVRYVEPIARKASYARRTPGGRSRPRGRRPGRGPPAQGKGRPPVRGPNSGNGAAGWAMDHGISSLKGERNELNLR